MADLRHSPDVYRRRRLVALGAVAAVAVAAGAAIGAGDRSKGDAPKTKLEAQQERGRQAELPLGGRTIFPKFRVVAFYGAPQSHALGALGIGSPDHAARRL